MHELIAAPFLGKFVLLKPGRLEGITLPERRFRELEREGAVPAWLVDAADRRWGISLPDRPISELVLVRRPSDFGHGRASWELNKGCDFGCDHCFLGDRPFAGLDESGKHALLRTMRDAGVLWLQMTGGEPLIDRDFASSAQLAHDLGMMIEVQTNGSRLARPEILSALASARPYRVAVSLYGATPETYDAFTHSRGAYKRVTAGLRAAVDAGVPIRLTLIITAQTAPEQAQMHDMADALGVPYTEYTHMSPTIYGGGAPLKSQSPAHLKLPGGFEGCNAGHTFFHADPHGKASICKVGRDEQIDLTQGVRALSRLGEIADGLMLRTGGCTGCRLSANCAVCRPLAKRYQEAKAPLNTYCQHGQEGSTA
ncbi:radical SAM protein [Kitasatospora sp. NPDC059463]|uniref:radical SAM protein n=1 Tax=unclassified Kitasatospora TaxID=2633591 RepID=UPI0036B5B44E